MTSDALGELPDRAGAGSPTRLALDVRGDLLLLLRGEQPDELLHRDQVVPDVQLRRRGVVADPISVRLHAPGHCLLSVARLQPCLSSQDDDARDEPRYVPLEGARQGLVKVAQVE